MRLIRRRRARSELFCGPVGDHLAESRDLPEITGHQQQRDEDALGGYAAHPPAPGGCERLVGWVLHVTVPALDRVAVTGIGAGPFLAAKGEVLAVAGTNVGGDGHRRLGAESWAGQLAGTAPGPCQER